MRYWLALVAFAAGCGAAAHNEGDTLDESIHIYNESVRWERFQKAANLLPPKERSSAIDEWDERSHDLKITEWELVETHPPVHDEVKAHVKLSWYRPSEEVLRITDALQTWHKQGKNWMLVDEARLRGPEMPGLPEPHVHRKPGSGAGSAAAEGPSTAVPNREETR
jgi:hypothetical protein